MAGAVGIRLHGLADLNRGLKNADKETRKGVRQSQRDVAEPVRAEATSLATRRIRNIQLGAVPWSAMRVGITQKLVYVAPKQRTRRSTRPKFGTLLMERAMEPALENNRHRFEADVDKMLERMAGHFNGSTLV